VERPSILTAVSKLAIAGVQAGFSLEEMIQFLNGGLSVEILLQLIAQRLADDDGRKPEASLDRSSQWVM
jgi:hypothetical protein